MSNKEANVEAKGPWQGGPVKRSAAANHSKGSSCGSNSGSSVAMSGGSPYVRMVEEDDMANENGDPLETARTLNQPTDRKLLSDVDKQDLSKNAEEPTDYKFRNPFKMTDLRKSKDDGSASQRIKWRLGKKTTAGVIEHEYNA